MKDTYSIVTVGYNKFCFKSLQEAMSFYQLVSQSIPVSHTYGDLDDGRKGISYIVDRDVSLNLEQVAAESCELLMTKEQIAEAVAARADVDVQANVVVERLEIAHVGNDDTPF